jgi:hypothetical protein
MKERQRLQELYAGYLDGRTTFEELTAATDRAVQEHERSKTDRAAREEPAQTPAEKRD